MLDHRSCGCCTSRQSTALPGCASSDQWTRTDSAYQFAYVVSIAADAYSTSRIQHSPGTLEQQPLARQILGPVPSTSDTWQFFATPGISHYLIGQALPTDWRRWWQVGGIAYHGYMAIENCDQGICSRQEATPNFCPACGDHRSLRGCSTKQMVRARGREDLGIDLVCEDCDRTLVIQCKRLSQEKQLPVRENVVAQIYGSAEFHRMCSGSAKTVVPVLVTTYRLSDVARQFAMHLGVETREHFELRAYPMIKCNISRVDNRKIYHLPMDQQYDKVIIGDTHGEFYAATTKEAESAGFRRAFRSLPELVTS